MQEQPVAIVPANNPVVNTPDFLNYLVGLAPEGETVLIVKQAAKKTGGYTFPAFLPERWRAGKIAWFGNTGLFHADRFEDGKPAARAAYCTHVAVLVCDDVGTKSKEPPVPPTWIMETSPGNYQWGYAFCEQPTVGEYCALYDAIAAAGYSDPGANNPVRNFRLPRSINRKPGNDDFAARLIEFDPSREYTPEQLAVAFDVTPGEAHRLAQTVALADDGGDDVLRWLSNNGHVLAPVNGAGWAGIACPRADRHTDGNLEARYMPATRSFVCLHAHCQDLDSEWFLDWIYEMGGPCADVGLRSDLLARTMAGVLAKLAPTEAYPDDKAALIAYEIRQLGRETKENMHERFAYVAPDDAYFDMQDRRDVTRAAFNAIFRHLDCKPNPSQWFDAHRDPRGGKILNGVTYAAGEGALCISAAGMYGNRWQNARPDLSLSTAAADVGPWLEHCRRLVTEPIELAHIWDIMAFKVQHPGIKINHAVLHAGPTRCGKDTMWAPFFWSIRGDTDRNVALVSSESLASQWGYDLLSEVMIINELRQTDSYDRRALENRLKPIIAAPPDFLPVNRKGLHPVNVANRVFVMAFSNFRDAIALPSDDGRWFVLWSDVGQMNAIEALRIWTWYKSAGGFAAVNVWLLARDVSRFNPAAPPMWTEAKALLCEQSLSTAESYLMECIRHSPEFTSGVIGGPFHGLLDRLGGGAPAGIKLVQNALFHALAEAEWVDCGRVRSADLQQLKRVFCRADLAYMSKSDLRRMAEDRPAPVLTLVPGKEKPAG